MRTAKTEGFLNSPLFAVQESRRLADRGETQLEREFRNSVRQAEPEKSGLTGIRELIKNGRIIKAIFVISGLVALFTYLQNYFFG